MFDYLLIKQTTQYIQYDLKLIQMHVIKEHVRFRSSWPRMAARTEPVPSSPGQAHYPTRLLCSLDHDI